MDNILNFSRFINEEVERAHRHKFAKKCEEYVASLCNGEVTTHKFPLDVIDWNNRVAYEVKAVSSDSVDMPFHIEEESYKRKIDFAKKENITPVLIAVVVYPDGKMDLYRGPLMLHFRLSALTKMEPNEVCMVSEPELYESKEVISFEKFAALRRLTEV